ncbi:MAG: hypothetical protein JWO19_5092 [Bryobacterales bacterium]|nr:hypothetical protein [Bryobacterales bacterium]
MTAGGGASPGVSRAGCEASTTGSCLGATGARDGSGEGAVSATRSAVSASGDAERGDPLDSDVSRRFTSIATGSSIELEWVFFSATPSSGSMSRITFGLTSSSRASSLIRIFVILCAPPSNSDTGVVRFKPAPYPEPPRLPGTLQFLSYQIAPGAPPRLQPVRRAPHLPHPPIQIVRSSSPLRPGFFPPSHR